MAGDTIEVRQARIDELADYLDALDEWGCESNEDVARQIMTFLASDVGLEIYREAGDHNPLTA